MCMSERHVYAVCIKTSRGCPISWNWRCRELLAAVFVLGSEPGSRQEQRVILTTVPPEWCEKKRLSVPQEETMFVISG